MTTLTQKLNQIKHGWHLIDIKDQILGRNATQIARLLMGKQKADYSPNLDMGDNVIVINTDKLKVTGKKLANKLYQRHSGWPGGFRELTLGELMEKDSRKVVLQAVKGMLPKNKLQDRRLARLKLFKDDQHPYQAEIKQ